MRAGRRHCMALRSLYGLMLAAVMAPAVAIAVIMIFGPHTSSAAAARP